MSKKKPHDNLTSLKTARKQSPPAAGAELVEGSNALTAAPDKTSTPPKNGATILEIGVTRKTSESTTVKQTSEKSEGSTRLTTSTRKAATRANLRLVAAAAGPEEKTDEPGGPEGPDEPDGPDDPGAAGAVSPAVGPDDPFTPKLDLLADEEDLNPVLRQNLELAQMILQGHLAANTHAGYKSSWGLWTAYAEKAGECPLPAKPAVVAAFLAELAIASDENGAVRENGKLVRRNVPGTVAQRLQAINKAHDVAGYPKPGAHPIVKGVVMGIRREFGVRPENQRRPIDMAMLIKVLAGIDNGSRERLNSNLILILAGLYGWTAGQMVRLRWADIKIDPTEVEITVPSTVPGQPGKTLTVRRHRDPRLCLVRALTQMRQYRIHRQEVITKKNGAPYSRFGLHKRLTALRNEAGALCADGEPFTSAFVRNRFQVVGDRTGKETRDRAILLVGFSCALRRANIVALNWGDMARVGEQWGATIRRSKTDQFGADEHTLWLPVAADGYPCPSAAMTAWHQTVTELLGSDPCVTHPDLPVFFRIGRHGNVPAGEHGARVARLSGTAVNRMVQERVYAVLPKDRPSPSQKNGRRGHQWGAHSLRAGFVTEAVRGNKLDYGQIQRVTRHQSITMVMRYDRNENARENNPSTKLFQPPAD